MQNEKPEPSPQQTDAPESTDSPSAGKKPWQEPKLAFVEPKLTQHGSLEEVTGQGFLGSFSPG